MTHYIGLLDGKKGGYGIAFPDLPGCTAMGRTMEEARRNAIAALADWIGEMGGLEAVPAPSDPETLRLNGEAQEAIREGAFPIAIPLLIESGRSVRANISMDQGILAAIDAAAEERGLTRSSFLASAAIEKIRAEVKP
ncbi:MAG: type II toxin-antitoxin system HicB family antitoxin [Methylocystis sp.]|jgi:predicted RNase H-like HicB family nuclease|nr:type II toxin-antitoxin system HicB family antitoxin [Methylocystis sp.]MCA3584810.1 type II toxin-antitoxin system HicB family antitoxin [Methylocystis sp.]MCA3587509.1 type II toxin-antitoxin system HicB family antitoxin [Methylocystis sp.]MCA3593005.1 type II toxin-antitoxin system HicB family antitoxin [Methylocystis sp.]